MKFKIVLVLLITILLTSCASKEDEDKPVFKKKRINPNVTERVEATETEGLFSRGMGGSTTYEFATSNVLWRASLETLNFLPIKTLSYSGGVIITDWYTPNQSKANEMIQFTVRFLSSDLAISSVTVEGFKKVCNEKMTCTTEKTGDFLNNEIKSSIIKKARALKIEDAKRKK